MRPQPDNTTAELLRLGLPMLVSQGVFALMIFTDHYFLSRLSPTHMAAGLGGGVAAHFSICFFSGLMAYATALAAQYFGAGEKGKCAKVTSQGFVIIGASAPLLALIAALVAGSFAAMGHDPRQVELERTYYLILMAGAVILLAKVCLSSYFAGIGRTRVVMLCDVCSLLVNVPLCAAMVFGYAGLPALGIVGAGVSTLIATLVGLLLFAAFYFAPAHRREFRVQESFHFDRGIFGRFMRYGSPAGAELFLNLAAFNLFLLMFQGYGLREAAAAAIVFNWDILSFVPMVGLGIATMSLAGRFVGGGALARVDEVIRAGFILGLGYSGAMALLYILSRHTLIDVFATPGADFAPIRELAAFMMVGLATYTMADAVIQVAAGVMRGAGDTRWLMYASVSLHWAMLTCQYFIIRVYDFGPRVAWVVFCGMIFALAVAFVCRLRGNRWRDPRTIQAVMAEYGGAKP